MSVIGTIVPIADVDSRDYWNGCRNRQLLVRRCNDCRTYRLPPGPGCPECGSMDSEWVKIDGKGEIYTYTLVYQTKEPYSIIVVSLPEADGVHMLSSLVDCPIDQIRIGMAVEVVFQDTGDGMALPVFRPLSRQDCMPCLPTGTANE